MKKVNKLLCAALALCMVIGLVPAIALADGEKPVYVVLGDSVASGYSLDTYSRNAGGDGYLNDAVLADGCYADIIGKTLDADVRLHAHSGWRVDEFLRMMHGEREGSELSDFLLKGLDTINGRKLEDQIYSESTRTPADLAQADIITVCFGSNDIYTYGLASVVLDKMDFFNNFDLANYDITKAKTPEEWKNVIGNIFNTIFGVIGGVETFMKKCDEGLENFKKVLPEMLDYITENMKDGAKVYLQSVSAPGNIDISLGGISIDIHSKFDRLADAANCFIMNQCAQYDNVYYVDVAGAEYNGLSALAGGIQTDELWQTGLMLLKVVHPGEAGHAFIAERFLEAMERAEMKPEVKVGVNILQQIRVSWNSVPGAKAYQIYRAESADGEYKLVGATQGNAWIDVLSSSREGKFFYKVSASTDVKGQNKTSFSDAVEYDVVDVGFSAGIVVGTLRGLIAKITLPLRITGILTDVIMKAIGNIVKF